MKKDGINLELLVEIFEKSLNSSAIVVHDVQLPVISSSIGATRQCDVVIYQGAPPRQTITIVEVQDRTNKPSRNDFGGWIEKMKEVGAQHLICVSKKGFTATQKEKAAQMGNSIRLIEFKDLKDSKIPLNFEFFFSHVDFEIKILNTKNVKFTPAEKNEIDNPIIAGEKISLPEKSVNDPVFTIDRINYLSLTQLINGVFNISEEDSNKNSNGRVSVKFPKDINLQISIQDYFFNIEFEVGFVWQNKFYNLGVTTLSYEQDGFGTLGWVAEMIHTTGVKKMSYKMPIELCPDGTYLVRAMYCDTFENNKLVKREIL